MIAAEAPEWLSVCVVDETDTARFAAEMRDAEVLLHVLEPVTAAVIAAAPRLRLIQKIGVGVDTIDLEAAKARNIAVANMPGTNSRAVAELTIMLMLAALRRLVFLDKATRSGRGWKLEPAQFDQSGELAGRVVGLVGFGRVGSLLAPILNAFGATVLATDKTGVTATGVTEKSLGDLLGEADIVSLHVPLTPQTENMIDARALARMKPGSVLINTARGGLVSEPALVAALKSGHLRAAGLDVFASEPAPADNKLLGLENVIVTPHVSWLTPETLARSLHVAFENCRRVRDGATPKNKVF
ncbi:MAG: hydroxyacid dehydrogenase [Alphaproteobacteria bacterium]|nr:hydroxyacid dehydrogenase [Alphaproteobacteria bacterium]